MRQDKAPPTGCVAGKRHWRVLTGLAACALALCLPAHAQDAPAVSPALKKLLGALPIAGIKDDVQAMAGALRKTSCGGKLTGCYMTQSGPLQLYFFTSGQTQQTLLLVVDKSVAMPRLLGEKVQKVMGETSLSSPIISISTTDFALDNAWMPPPLQKVVRDNYFNINTLSFSSGVQVAARAALGGPIKLAMESMGVKSNELMMRAAVVMPIPADLAAGAGGAAAGADAVAHGNTLTRAGLDAVKPEAFVEFQFAPSARLPLTLPKVTLTDATFFINNALTFGFKGNAAFPGAENKKVILQFQTPLSPAGAMDLLDFSFRMATPANYTMEDAAHMMVAMATSDSRLAKYGGGFIRGIDTFKGPLLAMTKPLSVVQLRNPQPPPEYRFGDSSKPFPDDNKYFNFILAGPTATDGPLLSAAGDVAILGQKMGWLYASAGQSGLRGDVGETVTLKLGPLGKVPFKMQATMAINADTQDVSLLGNFAGQKVSVGLSGSTMKVDVSASCVNPFAISTQLEIQASTNIADVFDGQGGVNVDPSKISGCLGKELEAAYNKIAGEFSHLGGYTAAAANVELNKIASAAAAEYNQAKAAARKAADKSIKAVSTTLSGATSAVVNTMGSTSKSHYDPKAYQFDRSVFDWDYYYDKYPDLVKKKTDLVAHWDKTGFYQRFRGSREFDLAFYAKNNPDAAALQDTGHPEDGLVLHWMVWGFPRGRQGSADFDVTAYLARYPDLQKAFGGTNYKAAFVHWLEAGKAEGRDGRPGASSQVPPAGTQRVGGGGGTPWDDSVVCRGTPIVGFRVRAGGSVDGLSFLYANGAWGPAHGNLGKPPYTAEVKLASGEYIVAASTRSGNRVDTLVFSTNKGRNFSYGYAGGSGPPPTYKVPAGQTLGCLAGRAGDSIDQLTFSSMGLR